MSAEPLLPPRGEDWELTGNCSFDFHSKEEDSAPPQLSLELKNELVVMDRGAWQRSWIVQWSRRKVIDPFFMILQRGLEPKLLSLSAALGLTIGVFPICGVTLVLCAIAAVLLQSNCHVPTLMLGNFVASLFELGLVVPFMRAGELVTGGEHFSLSSSGFWEAIRGHEPHVLVFGMLHAIIGWSIFAPVSVAVFYIGFLPIFQYLTARFGATKLLLHQFPAGNGHAEVRQNNASPSNHEYLMDV